MALMNCWLEQCPLFINGVKGIRFAPGWSNDKSDQYWTYAFLCYLDGSSKTDAGIMSGNLKAYYTGLIEVNSEGHNVPGKKLKL